MMAGGALRFRSLMVASKFFDRHGLVISALGHVGLLAIGLFLAQGGGAQQAVPPPDAVPPDAQLVELVTPQEIPRFSGTPSELRTSGTETAAPSPAPIPMKQPPQPAPVPAPQKEPSQKEQPQKDTQQKEAPQKEQRKVERNAASKSQEPQTAPAQKQELPVPQAEAGEIALTKPDSPAPASQEAPDASDAVTTMAQLALLGGPLDGGFAAPPVNSPMVGYDFTLLFRERVSSCAAMPEGIDRNEKISITLRVFLNRDGTLAAPPRSLERNPSAKQQALMQSFATGLEKCQPYTMLPPDKYKQWKTLDLVVYPLNAFGG